MLVACAAETESSGFLVVSMHTGDLELPADTDLVGLYIAQIEPDGRTRNVLAYEATPLREKNQPARVVFPADLVVVSRGETDRVHVRLVAYKQRTHEVLTMREARTQVPVDEGKALRLNLFFINQSNVQDKSPGQPMLTNVDGVQVLDQQGEISGDAFARFVSVCNGAPAPVDMTAGDDGSCVPLDLKYEELLAPDAPAIVVGTRREDNCYDITQTFAPRADQAVPTIDTATLPATGECRVPLPRRFDPERLNVAMVTSEPVFLSPDYPGKGLRPLPAKLAFRQEGDELVLPARVCDLARRPEVSALALSQRTDAWGGAEPVCSDWSKAKAPRSFDGPPPGDRPDGAVPDGSTEPALAEYEISARRPLHSLAGRNGTTGVITGSGSGPFELLTVPESQLGSGVVETRSSTSLEVFGPPRLRAVTYPADPRGAPEFYVQMGASGGLHVVQANGDLVLVDALGTDRPVAMQQVGNGPVAFYGADADGSSAIHVAELQRGGAVKPLTSVAGIAYGLAPELGAIGTEQLFVPNQDFPQRWLTCSNPASNDFSCEESNLENPPSFLTYGSSARVGADYFGFVRDSSTPLVIDYVSKKKIPVADDYPLPEQPVSVGSQFCAVYPQRQQPDRRSVYCANATEVRSGQLGTLVLEDLGVVALASDDSWLYLAYQCPTPVESPIHVARIRADALSQSGIQSKCDSTQKDGGP